jgi:hypothetical protein
MLGEDFFTNMDIYAYYAATCESVFPCPTHLFLCIRDINQLRRQIVAGQLKPETTKAAAETILNSISAFDPELWTERYKMPPPATFALLAQIYQSATTLYANMALVRHTQIPLTRERRLALANSLGGLVGLGAEKWGPHLALAWPLTVAGAALGAATAGEQAVVDVHMYAIGQSMDASDGILYALECLRRFWRSGKTGWEECFTEWQATIP